MVAHAAYLPGERIVGLSKLARVVDLFARAPTVASGFHGLGPFGAVAYFAAVVPRFRAARPAAQLRPVAVRLGSEVALRRGERTAAEALALVAAVLVFASSFLHTAVIAARMEYWVPFVVATCAQAVWATLGYRAPRNRRVLVAGAAGNGALVVVWAIRRRVGMPVGPDPGVPEAVRGADVLSTLDELMAVGIAGVVLAASGGRIAVTAALRAACHVPRRAAVHLEQPRRRRRQTSPLT